MDNRKRASLSSSGQPLPVVIVSGLSGSGKSTALAVFEDLGFFTVDGLPTTLASEIVDVIAKKGAANYSGVALGMDLRQGDFDNSYDTVLLSLEEHGYQPQVLFLEAKEDVLLKRYAATRRPHPLEKDGFGLERALEMERHRLRKVRRRAGMVLDTSTYSIHDLRRVLQGKWKKFRPADNTLRIHLVSFGFKYGTPSEADMVFDLRFLPNPYFIEELKPLSGRAPEVSAFVLGQDPGKSYLEKLKEFLLYTLKLCEAEGRYRMTLGIGCTGGRHRSVAVAEALVGSLKEQGYSLTLEHRHLELG